MKSLQDKYNLIKEGKGNRELFLKEARNMFPNIVTGALTFNQAIHNLTERGIISENTALSGVAQPQTPDWFKIFKENTESVKAELKDTDKEVEEMETRGYDYKEKKNNNNISTAEILAGYYAEMKDPKNAEKTEEEIKKIVFKNLEKDPLHYIKDGQFGVKGLGYTEEHPGLGPTKEVTGKYKSSGMEPVKLNEVFYGSSDGDFDANQEDIQMAYYNYDKGLEAYSEGDFLKADKYYTAALRYGSYVGWTEQDLPPYEKATGSSLEEDKVPGSNIKKVGDKWRILSGKTGKMWKAHYDTKEDAEAGLKAYFASQHESLEKEADVLLEAKRKAVEKHLKEIEKLGEIAAVAHKIEKINEKIEELSSKLSMTEGDDVKDMVDKKAVKEIQKDIKLYEKKKAFYEKMHSKMSKKAGAHTMEEEAPIVEVEEEKPFTPPTDPDRDMIFKSMKRDVKNPRSWETMVKDLLKDKVPGTSK